jgi:hypothetical protein
MDVDRWIDTVGNGCYTLLHMQALDDNCRVLRRIRERAPDALILVRFYQENWFALDPEAFARGDALAVYKAIRPYTRHFTWANEQNLRSESGGRIGAAYGVRCSRADYMTIDAWNRKFIAAFRATGDGAEAVLHYPAFATGHSDDQADYPDDPFVGLLLCQQGIAACEILDRHYYPELGYPVTDLYRGAARVNLASALFPTKPIFISESGNFAVLSSLSPQHYLDCGYYWQGHRSVIGHTPFIADDPTGAHGANNMSNNPNIFHAISNATKTAEDDAVDGAIDVVRGVPTTTTPEVIDIGAGFRKVEQQTDLGKALASEEWFSFRRPGRIASICLFERGRATWGSKDNQTVAINEVTGTIWSDGGNFPHQPSGLMTLVWQGR